MRIQQHHYEWECPYEKMLDDLTRMKTLSLFCETMSQGYRQKGNYPVYSISDHDKEWRHPDTGETIWVPSAYLIFMSSIDEFDAAMKIVGNYRHWEKLKATKWFMEGFQGYPGLNDWLEDMRLRDLSKAKRILEEEAENGNVSAAKALFQNSKTKQKAGRPVKEKNKPVDYTADIDKLYDNVIGINKKG